MTLPTITVADVIQLIKDYSRNQNLEDARGIRLVNSAVDLVFTQWGIPAQELEYSFYFDETQPTYALPEDFAEALFLRYADDTLNENAHFSYRPAELLFDRVTAVGEDTRLFGVDAASGNWRLYVLGNNSIPSSEIDSFDYDNTAHWIATNDATNVTTDTIIYKEGAGCLKFDIVAGLSGLDRATLTRTVDATDLNAQYQVGHFKVWCYLSNVTNFTSISFNWGSDASNYFKSTVTTQEDGTAFAVGWNKLDFQWDGATEVNAPDPRSITLYWFDFDYTAAYTGGTNYRLDYLRLDTPDEMILTYITRFKGIDSTGVNNLYEFTALTDKFVFPTFDTTVKNTIALYGAVTLNPQLLVDDAAVKEQYKFYGLEMSRRYPRKRINNLLAIPNLPKTD